MMTEGELKELEKGLHDSEGLFFDHMLWMADNAPKLLALIAEVRRLNAAYAKLLHEIDTSAAINSMPFYDMARNIFEPELTD